MPRIQQLPPQVVNQIAAGEVIERPASVVKELVENALDAGAQRIDVAVEQGGMELVRVVDDGSGIEPDDLLLAMTSHATSKLRDAEDLFRVRTLGFRGEALASMAAVSRTTVRSRTPERDAGLELEVVGAKPGEIVPCGAPVGTLLEVRQLFYNTPVRKKFLRSAQTEMSHVSEALTRLALASPEIHFTLRHNQRQVYDLPPVDDWRQRIAVFFGQELADDLVWVESVDSDIRLSGFVARPNHSRSHAKMQYLFLNGRHIRDRALQHALGESYRGLLLTGRYPISFLRFEMPPEAVDVNVHPTKLEVRFLDGGRLYSQLLGTLRTKFLATDLTHRLEPVAAAKGPADEDAPQQVQRLVSWARAQTTEWPAQSSPARGRYAGEDGVPPFRPFSDGHDVVSRSGEPLRLNPLPGRGAVGSPASAHTNLAPPANPVENADTQGLDALSQRLDSAETNGAAGPSEPTLRAMQVHNRYLVAEVDDGMLVIDQHALHERILYEQLKARLAAGRLEVQRLLVPEPVDLAPAEAALVLERRVELSQLGVGVEPFGGDTVLVTSYPALLARFRPAEVLHAVLDPLVASGRSPTSGDLFDELLHQFACKAAVKAGDPLSEGEVTALLEQRHLVHDTHHCPHGRPTALVFTREELDKQFKRT